MFCIHCGRELDENGNCICEESKKAAEKVAMKAMKIPVKVFKNNYAQELRLSVAESVLGIGMEVPVQISAVPVDAEDINELEVTIEDPTVLQLVGKKMVKAIGPGHSRIFVSGILCKAEVLMTVLPELERIQPDIASVKCYVGEMIDVNVNLLPANAYNCEYTWKSSNERVAVVLQREDGTEYIKATGIGSCVLTCKVVSGEAGATIPVQVESTLSKNDHRNRYIIFTAAMVVATFVFLLANKDFFGMLCVLGTIGAGLLTCFKEKWNWFWALLLIGIAILLLIVKLFDL